jgi:hypothetical protein
VEFYQNCKKIEVQVTNLHSFSWIQLMPCFQNTLFCLEWKTMDIVQKLSISNCNLSLSEPILVRGTGLNKPICYKRVSLLRYDKVLPVKWFLTVQRIMLLSSVTAVSTVLFICQKLEASSTIKYCV